MLGLKTWNVAISDPQGESLSLWFRQVPIPIIKSKEMCFARRILRYFPFAMIPFAFEVSCLIRFNLFRRIYLFFHFLNWKIVSLCFFEESMINLYWNRFFRMGNYKRFLLTTAAEASFLQYCIIEPYIIEVTIHISFIQNFFLAFQQLVSLLTTMITLNRWNYLYSFRLDIKLICYLLFKISVLVLNSQSINEKKKVVVIFLIVLYSVF